MNNLYLKDNQLGLIHLIEWYRDEYHKTDFGHTKMIEEIKNTTDNNQLEKYYKILDGWLDY
jgi:hypothetical protein